MRILVFADSQSDLRTAEQMQQAPQVLSLPDRIIRKLKMAGNIKQTVTENEFAQKRCEQTFLRRGKEKGGLRQLVMSCASVRETKEIIDDPGDLIAPGGKK